MPRKRDELREDARTAFRILMEAGRPVHRLELARMIAERTWRPHTDKMIDATVREASALGAEQTSSRSGFWHVKGVCGAGSAGDAASEAAIAHLAALVNALLSLRPCSPRVNRLVAKLLVVQAEAGQPDPTPSVTDVAPGAARTP